jgi:hypothetical protein
MWRVEFQFDERLRSMEPHLSKPKCIFKANDWIDEFRTGRRSIYNKKSISLEFPKYVLVTKLNEFLKPISVVLNDQIKTYTITFNPYSAYVNKKTFVTIDSTLMGETTSVKYPEIKANCPE